MLPVSGVTKDIISEKKDRIRELMKMMGADSMTIWLSWIIKWVRALSSLSPLLAVSLLRRVLNPGRLPTLVLPQTAAGAHLPCDRRDHLGPLHRGTESLLARVRACDPHVHPAELAAFYQQYWKDRAAADRAAKDLVAEDRAAVRRPPSDRDDRHAPGKGKRRTPKKSGR